MVDKWLTDIGQYTTDLSIGGIQCHYTVILIVTK